MDCFLRFVCDKGAETLQISIFKPFFIKNLSVPFAQKEYDIFLCFTNNLDLFIGTYRLYLGISDTDVNDLINSGKLDSAIYKDGEICIISKQALQEWVNNQIGNGWSK